MNQYARDASNRRGPPLKYSLDFLLVCQRASLVFKWRLLNDHVSLVALRTSRLRHFLVSVGFVC
jgi:hypothetical protein